MLGLTELSQVLSLRDIRLSWLLQAWWLAFMLPILVVSIPLSPLASFRDLLLGFARRGKTMPPSSPQKFTVPKKFFLHFYVLSVVWTTALLVLTWNYAYKVAPLDSDPMSHLTGGAHIFSLHNSHHRTSVSQSRYLVWRSVFLLMLMETQVLRRLYETLYVFKHSHSGRMHILLYLLGHCFYVAVPLSLCHGCVVEVLNFTADQVAEFYVTPAQERMSVIEHDFWGYLKPLRKLGWCEWAGAAVFLWGWIHQLSCHAILVCYESTCCVCPICLMPVCHTVTQMPILQGSLRQRKTDRDKHLTPTGDWFNYVSSPHYLAEMVIYAGLVTASGGTDLTIWLVFALTVVNLCFAAGETHRWYLDKFEDYPRDRKAVIPLVY